MFKSLCARIAGVFRSNPDREHLPVLDACPRLASVKAFGMSWFGASSVANDQEIYPID
jgi:hypothetical protein